MHSIIQTFKHSDGAFFTRLPAVNAAPAEPSAARKRPLSLIKEVPALSELHARSDKNENTEALNVSMMKTFYAFFQDVLATKKNPDGSEPGGLVLDAIKAFMPDVLPDSHDARCAHLLAALMKSEADVCELMCLFVASKCTCRLISACSCRSSMHAP